jgi:hypothetical protein
MVSARGDDKIKKPRAANSWLKVLAERTMCIVTHMVRLSAQGVNIRRSGSLDKKTGSIDSNAKDNIKRWIKDKDISFWKCCQGQSLIIADHIIDMSPFTPGVIIGGAPNYPAVLIICTNCGYMQFVSALLSGAITPPRPATGKEEMNNDK